jgi:hypothetical protein
MELTGTQYTSKNVSAGTEERREWQRLALVS